MEKRKLLLLLFLNFIVANITFAQPLSTSISSGESATNLQQSDSTKVKRFRFGLCVEVESSLYNTTDTSLFKKAIDVGKLGLTADFLLREKWNLHLDLLTKRTRENLIIPIDSTHGNSQDFDFGLIETSHFYRLNEFYFLESALILSRRINTRHSVGLGLGMSYLFTVKGQLVKKERVILRDFPSEDLKIVNKEGVINEGFGEKGAEITTSFLNFIQLRYDFMPTQNSSLFLKLNGQYNSKNYLQKPWLSPQEKFLQIDAALGFNYRF